MAQVLEISISTTCKFSGMLKIYIKIAWRNLIRNKFSTIINILGLSTGMAIALLISLWIWDEITFDHYHKNHKQIAMVMKTLSFNGNLNTDGAIPAPVGNELRNKYGHYFKDVAMISKGRSFSLTVGAKSISRIGIWAEPAFPKMFSYKVVKGKLSALTDPSAILLNQSTANALFGKTDPINKVVKLDNNESFTVAGVYEDIPVNSDMRVDLLIPWSKYVTVDENIKNNLTNWFNHSWSCFVQLNDASAMDEVSAMIKNIQPHNPNEKNTANISLYPMDKWRLYDEFKNGEPVSGRIRYVQMFGIIGISILLLACINFMNLSTAHSEKRAKEVGIRKTVGSLRSQLIKQFFSESILLVLIAMFISLVWASLLLDLFNSLANKQLSIPWLNERFWFSALLFVLVIGIISGSYPAFYLSRFKPAVVFKGIIKPGKYSLRTRQVLVVIQFTFSIFLIIGTIIVFKQIQYAKDRPVGYTTAGLITIDVSASNLTKHYDALKTDLLNSGVVAAIARSSCPTTWICSDRFGFDWEGKDPRVSPNFGTISISDNYGETIGWQIKEGRDFSKDLKTDSAAVIINEAARKLIGSQQIVGKTITDNGTKYRIIGVIKDMIINSPYAATINPVIFYLNPDPGKILTIRISPAVPASAAIAKMDHIFKKYHPSAPFRYEFNDELYAKKFLEEQRIGKLAVIFTILAILISCLGVFGLASFVAEQRTKEMGIRKILGASAFNLWRLLSFDFFRLVIIASIIAIPIAWWSLHSWLQNYEYRTAVSLWVFLAPCVGALFITLLTVGVQTIKAVIVNPARSLRND